MHNLDQVLEHRRGSTFVLELRFDEKVGGEPIDISNMTIKCQIRDIKSILIEELSVSITDGPAGLYKIQSAGTEAWPVGNLYMDILYLDELGYTVNTERLTIILKRQVTV